MSSDFSTSKFLSKFKNPARPNRFRVEFQLPMGIVASASLTGVNNTSLNGIILNQQFYYNTNDTINILCHTTQFPGRDINTIPAGGGYAAAVPITQQYDAISFQFYTDANYSTREYFDIWQNTVFNVKSRTINYYNEYVSDVKMYALDRTGAVSYGITLKEAYPISLSAIDLSAESSTSLQNVTIGMSYKYWVSNTVQSRN